MAKKIENKDLFASDFLEPQKKSLQEVIELIKLMESEMKDVLKVQQQMLKQSDTKSVKGLEQRKKAITNINQVSKEMLKLEQQRKKTSAQLQLAETEQAKKLERTRQQLNAKKKAVREQIKAENQLTNGYAQQSKRLNELRKKYKDLILTEGKQTKESRKLRKEITQLDAKLKKVDAQTGQFQRNVGNYPKVFGSAINALRSFGLALGGVAVVRDIFGKVSEFEQSIANLSAITGATGDDLDFLKNKAIELGESTTLSSSQVAEGFKLIASAKPELLENGEALASVTNEAIKLAEAAGLELPEAASALANTLNQFNAGAESASEFVDVLAAGAKFGAGDINFLNEAFKKAGTVAASSGIQFSDASAALEVLAEKGVDASTAGTNFRNILLNLQKEGIGFVNGQFDMNFALENAKELLDNIEDAGERAEAKVKLFGKQNIASAEALLNNSKRLKELQTELQKTGIAAEQQEKNTNTLQGAIKSLQSAWEGFILRLNEGTGAFGFVRNAIQWLADNFNTVISFVKTAAIAWGTYKASLLLVNKETGKFKNFGIVSMLKNLISGLKGASGAAKSASGGFKALGTAIKSIPLVGWISGITTAISLLSDFGSEASFAAEQQERLNESLEQGAKNVEEENNALVQGFNDRLTIEKNLLAQKLKDIKSEKEKRKVIQRTGASIKAFAKGEIAFIEEKIKKRQEEAKELKLGDREQKDRYNVLSAELEKLEETRRKFIELRDNSEGKSWTLYSELQRERNKLNAQNTQKKVELDEKEVKSAKKVSEFEKIRNEILKDRLDTISEIFALDFESQITDLTQEIDKELERQNEIALSDPASVNVDKLEELMLKRFEIQKEAILKEKEFRLKELKSEQEEALEEIKNNETLSKEEKIKLRQETNDLYKQKRIAVEQEINNELKDLTNNYVETLDEANDQIIENQIQGSDKINKKSISDLKKQKQILQERFNAFKEFTSKIIELMDARTDKQLENIDKEIEASKKRQEQLEELANKGNLKAEQSVSAEIKRQAELERQKEALEKKKLRRKAFIEGLDLLSSKIDSGEKDAVASTLRDMTTLLSALATLPGFYEGTNTTVADALGKPNLSSGKDGYLVRVDGAEKVLNPSMSARTGNMTTEEITRAAELYNSGALDYQMLIHPKVQELNTPYQSNADILRKFDSLERTIKDKPILSDLKFDELSKALIVAVEANGDLKRTHYKLK
jgi:TP901 family phage tail tape measure protein